MNAKSLCYNVSDAEKGDTITRKQKMNINERFILLQQVCGYGYYEHTINRSFRNGDRYDFFSTDVIIKCSVATYQTCNHLDICTTGGSC
jgi:hypothetical protein